MWIVADVTYDTDAEAQEAERLARENKLATLSVRLADVTAQLEILAFDDLGQPSDWLETVSKGEVVSVTQLPVPAQGGARIVANPDGTFTAWIVEEGMQTSDRRIIEPDALFWRDPAPLTFSDREDGAHESAVFVGNLSNFRRAEMSMVAAFTVVPEHFTDPQLPAVTKPHIEDGRFVGHGAQWGTCHLAFQGCVTPPETQTNYEVAHWREAPTADILGVPIYKHPKGDNHAPLSLTLAEARQWYEEECSLEGIASVGDDAFGIWVSGSASPEIDGMFLSGDWRLVGDSLELTAFLACERPAFPLALVAADVQTALVAAGIVTETQPQDPRDEIVRALAAEVVYLRSEVEPLVMEREARILLESLV